MMFQLISLPSYKYSTKGRRPQELKEPHHDQEPGSQKNSRAPLPPELKEPLHAQGPGSEKAEGQTAANNSQYQSQPSPPKGLVKDVYQESLATLRRDKHLH